MKKSLLCLFAVVVAFSLAGCGPSKGQIALEKTYKDAMVTLNEAIKDLETAKNGDDAAKGLMKGMEALNKAKTQEEAIMKEHTVTESEALKKTQDDFMAVTEKFTNQMTTAAGKYSDNKKMQDALKKISEMK